MEDKRILIRSIPGVFDNVVYIYLEDFFPIKDTFDHRIYGMNSEKIRESVNNKMGYEFLNPYEWRLGKSLDFEEFGDYIVSLIRNNEIEIHIYCNYFGKCFTCKNPGDFFLSLT